MIKCIWAEIRPALKSCNLCVVLKKEINSAVKMTVKKGNLLLEISGKRFDINFPDFVVEPLSLTGFKIAKQFLYFRIQTECKFDCQSIPAPRSTPPIKDKEKVAFLCKCDNPLTKEVTFERILPLPSSELNPSELFCHVPESPLKMSGLTPKPNDCFYSDHFLVVNEEVLTGCVRKCKFLKCKRCLTAVGVCDRSSVKFWAANIQLPFEDVSPLKQLKRWILRAVSDPFSMFPKLLLECEENRSFLSIVVVDKNLVVSSCQKNLQLKSAQVVKLKYAFHPSRDSLVKAVEDDVFHCLHIQVHQSMLDFSVRFLTSNSKSIPPLFSRVGNECMAYLNLTD